MTILPAHVAHAQTAQRSGRPWPLLVIGASAFVAVWGGWVYLGSLTGFGVIAPLPGIADGFRINTAITLPLGVEAYGAYALAVATRHTAHPAARRFAVRSSIAALGLGILGQVASHVLSAAHAATAPLAVTIFVSCMPVVVVGAAARLWHLTGHPVQPEPAGGKAAALAGLVAGLPDGLPDGTVVVDAKRGSRDRFAPAVMAAMTRHPQGYERTERTERPSRDRFAPAVDAALRSVPTGASTGKQGQAVAELRRRGLTTGRLPGSIRDEIAAALKTSPDTVRRAHRALRRNQVEAAG